MKVKEITVTLKQTYNLGNYSSVAPDVTITAEVVEGDSAETVIDYLQHTARLAVRAEIDRTLAGLGKAPVYGSAGVVVPEPEF